MIENGDSASRKYVEITMLDLFLRVTRFAVRVRHDHLRFIPPLM